MVYLLFFLSGAAALVYEIAWSRQLGLFFGHTVHAAAVVLGAYFAGMALGNWLAGRFVGRLARPLLGYGIAELCVAAWVLATPSVLRLYATAQIAALLNHDDPALQLAIRAVVAFATLLPATIALGATLPFIAQHVSPPGEPQPRRIALAYACNTAGAFTGVAAATAVLILAMGVSGSSYLAAALSALCGLAALTLARKPLKHPPTPPDTPPAHPQQAPGTAAVHRRPVQAPSGVVGGLATPWWYLLAAVSGGGTLALQVLATRQFALVMQNSTYTFGTVVAVFLCALALGAFLAAQLVKRWSATLVAVGACGLGAAAIPLSVVLFQRLTQLQSLASNASYGGYLLHVTGLAALCLAIPVTLLGLVLPAAFIAARQADGGPGAAIGRLTALNTVFAAMGALLASFVLLPQLGLWNAFALLAVLYLGLAVVTGNRVWGWRRIALPALAITALSVMAVIAVNRPPATLAGGESITWQRETPYGLISVTEGPYGDLTLRQNNNYRLGATYGLGLERRQAHVPLLLHPAPREVCFLGLATGITAGAALHHESVSRLTAIELIPEVAEAAALFNDWNNDVLTEPRAEIVLNDARHYLYATDRRFDVIVSDLFVPWHSQTGYLYTVEHYRAARDRLAEGGIFCQWLALYEVAPRELEVIADSFATVFPNTTVWRDAAIADYPLIALVGSEESLTLDGTQLTARWAAVTVSSGEYDPALSRGTDVLGYYIGRWEAGRAVGLNTDDHPLVEFLAPQSDGRHIKLTGNRLRDYYDAVLLNLPATGVEYAPGPGQPAPDLTALRQAQRDGIPDAPPLTERRLY